MIKSYPLTREGMPLRSHSIVGIYEIQDKIAFIHFAFGFVSAEQYAKDKLTPSYALLDVFSADFIERSQAYLEYNDKKIFSAYDAVCYWEDDRFFMNTKRYNGFSASIAKIIEIRDTELIEVDDAPAPIQQIYNDSKSYIFGDYVVRMASQFMMECRHKLSGETVWKLKLTAYLYSEVEERNGILYFGTAGKGGRFYGVSLVNGDVIFNYNTGGTERFAWYKDNVLLSNRKGKPVLLDSKDGSEIRQIDFGKLQFPAYQHMLVKGDRLYAVASDDAMYAVCVNLCENQE